MQLQEISAEEPTAGYRIAWAYLRQDGVVINHKRVQSGRKGKRAYTAGQVPILAVENEYTWEGLAVAVGRSTPADRVKEVLGKLFSERGSKDQLHHQEAASASENREVPKKSILSNVAFYLEDRDEKTFAVLVKAASHPFT